MRIFVWNFHKCKFVTVITKIIASILIMVLVTGVISNLYFDSDKYIQAMHTESEKNLIILDAGHGGEDPGAIGFDNVYEKNINLELVFEIGELLSERGFAVMYTRVEDKLLYSEEENIKGFRKTSDLKNRCKIAAEYPEAMFISIHMNSYQNPKYSGLQVYYSENNENSRILASNIQSSVKNELQNSNNRTVKAGDGMYILENINNSAVLIECGFLTNAEECKKLSEKEYQKQLSLAIVCGIIEYKELISSY